MRGMEFVINYVHLLYYKCHKINLNHGGSFKDSPDWMKNKNTTITPNKKNDISFEYTVTVMLNYEEIEKDVNNNKYLISFPPETDDWKRIEKNEI